MDPKFYPMLAVIISLSIFLALALVIKKKSKIKRPPDYYMHFTLGIMWIAIGIIMNNYLLIILGIPLTISGIIHKNKWKQNRVTWNILSDEEKKMKLLVVTLLTVVLFAGMLILWIANNQ